MRQLVAVALALGVGGVCRWSGVAAPCPPQFSGALLVVALTAGYALTDWLLK